MTSNLIVIKIGSSSLTDKIGRLDLPNIKRIARDIAKLKSLHKHVILVSSGAIVSGSGKLGYKEKPRAIQEKQAAAAVGQSLLMHEYQKAFAKHKITVGQILLTHDELHDSAKKKNAYLTISTLLKHSVVPIVNENDTVATDEIKVGDNDNLAAMVAVLMKAGLLINLTDVDGFYEKVGPGEMVKLDVINEITDKIKASASMSDKKHGTGGMKTKLEAANLCKSSGTVMIIANGKKADIVKVSATALGNDSSVVGTVFRL
ncbi:MAG: glutamate 5-kinase [Candidatus Saganbacteria bacterium]|nr:glutamate 5-kinase [Candidatus Saganbacteria bacterium]